MVAFLTDAKIFRISPTLQPTGNNVYTKTQQLRDKGKTMGIERRVRELLLREANLTQGEQREHLRGVLPRGMENSTHRNSRDPSGNSNNGDSRGGRGKIVGDGSPDERQIRPGEYPDGDNERTKVSEVVNWEVQMSC